VISKIIVAKNQTHYEQLIYLAEKFAFTTFWALAFTLILSFNFFVGVLEGNFKQLSAKLTGFDNKLMATTLYSSYPITTISNVSAMSGRAQSPSSSNLRGIEQQLLLIDHAIELITRVYSWNLIFLTIWFLTDLLFSIYLLSTPMKNGGPEISLHFIVITEALCFLFLMHNPADALSDAVSSDPGKVVMYNLMLGQKFSGKSTYTNTSTRPESLLFITTISVQKKVI
jgi:hypothetical protein